MRFLQVVVCNLQKTSRSFGWAFRRNRRARSVDSFELDCLLARLKGLPEPIPKDMEVTIDHDGEGKVKSYSLKKKKKVKVGPGGNDLRSKKSKKVVKGYAGVKLEKEHKPADIGNMAI